MHARRHLRKKKAVITPRRLMLRLYRANVLRFASAAENARLSAERRALRSMAVAATRRAIDRVLQLAAITSACEHRLQIGVLPIRDTDAAMRGRAGPLRLTVRCAACGLELELAAAALAPTLVFARELPSLYRIPRIARAPPLKWTPAIGRGGSGYRARRRRRLQHRPFSAYAGTPYTYYVTFSDDAGLKRTISYYVSSSRTISLD